MRFKWFLSEFSRLSFLKSDFHIEWLWFPLSFWIRSKQSLWKPLEMRGILCCSQRNPCWEGGPVLDLLGVCYWIAVFPCFRVSLWTPKCDLFIRVITLSLASQLNRSSGAYRYLKAMKAIPCLSMTSVVSLAFSVRLKQCEDQ